MATAIITSALQICDPNGVPYSGALITVSDAGLTNLRALFTDPGLTTPTANPIVTDASGRHQVGMVYTATGSYKIVVKNAVGASIFTRDNIDGGIPVGSGALAIVNGGTGATSAVAALSALGAATAAEVADLAAEVASLAGAAASTEKTHIAVGTTLQQPAAPIEGDIRRNTTIPQFEGYTSAWETFLTNVTGRAATSAIIAQTNQGTYVSPDRLAYSPVAVQAYGRFVVSAGTPALVAGFNFSGTISDNGAGDFTLNFTAALANANYTVQVTPYGTTTTIPRVDTTTAQTAALFRVKFVDPAGNGTDPGGFYVTVHGTHA